MRGNENYKAVRLETWSIILLMLTCLSCMNEIANLNVANLTGTTIDSLEASIFGFGQKQKHGKLLPNGVVKFQFRDYSDSHYKVKVYIENGTCYEDSLGYITHNCNFNDTIQILKADSGKIRLKYIYGAKAKE